MNGFLLNIERTEVEVQGQVDWVNFDFQKAFNKMPHFVLLQVLSGVGFSVAEFMSEEASFSICFWNGTGQSVLCVFWVPQSSYLGPFLFLLFVNAIFVLYAYDLKIYHCINSRNDHLKLLKNIDALAEWARLNFMPLNLTKTVCLLQGKQPSLIWITE